jgi:hypothetical protein
LPVGVKLATFTRDTSISGMIRLATRVLLLIIPLLLAGCNVPIVPVI